MKQTRQSIVNLFLTKLTQIRVANGYTCDIGQLVEYAEGVTEEPTIDCIAVFDGREELSTAPAIRNANRQRTLAVSLHAAFIGNEPRLRANAASEDIVEWLDKNPSLGTNGIRLYLGSFEVILDPLGELAELVCELQVTY